MCCSPFSPLLPLVCLFLDSQHTSNSTYSTYSTTGTEGLPPPSRNHPLSKRHPFCPWMFSQCTETLLKPAHLAYHTHYHKPSTYNPLFEA
jgi:hypothetical protein